jgi:hypothetical protein
MNFEHTVFSLQSKTAITLTTSDLLYDDLQVYFLAENKDNETLPSENQNESFISTSSGSSSRLSSESSSELGSESSSILNSTSNYALSISTTNSILVK